MEYDSLVKAITKVLQVYISEITLDSTFAEDLCADSIDMVQIFKLVESDLGIEVGNVDFEKTKTVNDALTIIKNAVKTE